MTIQVVKPGLFTTVQDLGRYGYAHLGISPGGAADPLSFRIANLLVGNDENAPALEMTLLGPTLAFKEGAVVAIAGADCDCQVDTAEAPINAALDLAPGTVLQCGSITSGARCYLAVQGGFEVPLVMGSASTFAPGHFGGLQGRRLQKGDVLQIGRHDSFPVRSLRPGSLDALRAPADCVSPKAHNMTGSGLMHLRSYSPLRISWARSRTAPACGFRERPCVRASLPNFLRTASPSALFRCRRMASRSFCLSISRPPEDIRKSRT